MNFGGFGWDWEGFKEAGEGLGVILGILGCSGIGSGVPRALPRLTNAAAAPGGIDSGGSWGLPQPGPAAPAAACAPGKRPGGPELGPGGEKFGEGAQEGVWESLS